MRRAIILLVSMIALTASAQSWLDVLAERDAKRLVGIEQINTATVESGRSLLRPPIATATSSLSKSAKSSGRPPGTRPIGCQPWSIATMSDYMTGTIRAVQDGMAYPSWIAAYRWLVDDPKACEDYEDYVDRSRPGACKICGDWFVGYAYKVGRDSPAAACEYPIEIVPDNDPCKNVKVTRERMYELFRKYELTGMLADEARRGDVKTNALDAFVAAANALPCSAIIEVYAEQTPDDRELVQWWAIDPQWKGGAVKTTIPYGCLQKPKWHAVALFADGR